MSKPQATQQAIPQATQQTMPQATQQAMQVPSQPNTSHTLLDTISTQVYQQQQCQPSGVGRQIYSIFHSLMAIVAIYMSYRCNNGFNLGSFLIACSCPYIYVIYMVATRGTCGILESVVGSGSGSGAGARTGAGTGTGSGSGSGSSTSSSPMAKSK